MSDENEKNFSINSEKENAEVPTLTSLLYKKKAQKINKLGAVSRPLEQTGKTELRGSLFKPESGSKENVSWSFQGPHSQSKLYPVLKILQTISVHSAWFYEKGRCTEGFGTEKSLYQGLSTELSPDSCPTLASSLGIKGALEAKSGSLGVFYSSFAPPHSPGVVTFVRVGNPGSNHILVLWSAESILSFLPQIHKIWLEPAF